MGDLHRQAMARGLARRLSLASLDEIRVVDRILVRLELGRERYGPLDIAKPREWRRELGEELLDAVIYDTIETIRAEDVAHEDLRGHAAEELAELERWRREDQRTRVSNESARIAIEHDPYDDLEIAVAEFGGEGG